MPTPLRRLLTGLRDAVGAKPARPEPSEDADLARFYTDMEEARSLFDQLLSTVAPPQPLLIVHGVGAVGKSSLLRMFRLAARKHGTPVALVPAEEAHSAVALVDLIGRLTRDLSEYHIDCFRTESVLDRYREVEAKATGGAADKSDKSASSLPGAVVNIVGHVAGGKGGEVISDKAVDAVAGLADALQSGLLKKSEAAFLRDPGGELRQALLADLGEATARGLIVLMIDTYEQISTLDAWVGELASQLPARVLLVLAGRVGPDWDRAWPGWRARARVLELEEMTPEHVRTLIRRYHSIVAGGAELDPQQVEVIVELARGVPLAATTAVQFLVNYRLSDAQTVRTQLALVLRDRFLEGVPVGDRPHFEAAAILRYFNVGALGAVLDAGSDPAAVFETLRGWPFMRPHRYGLSVHDVWREVIATAVRGSSEQRFVELNTRAAEFYTRLSEGSGDEADRAVLELLYHRMRYEENVAMSEFRRRAEELVRPRLLARLRSLLGDVNTFPLSEPKNILWRTYYGARLAHLEGRAEDAEQVYRQLAEDATADATLRAYALCDLGGLLDDFERLSQPDGPARARAVVERSLALQPVLDAKLLSNYTTLTNLANARSAWIESLGYLDALRQQLEPLGDTYGLTQTHNDMSAVHALRGNWAGYLEERAICRQLLEGVAPEAAVRMSVLYFNWPLTLMGRYAEAERDGVAALALAERLEEREDRVAVLESLALAEGVQRRDEVADAHFAHALAFPDPGVGQAHERLIRATLSFKGLVELHREDLQAAQADLERALAIKLQIDDRMGIPEVYVWLGELAELAADWPRARQRYDECLAMRDLGRRYFECGALVGLERVMRQLGASHQADQYARQARPIADELHYYDLSAVLHLSAGNVVSQLPEAGQAYRRALVDALRYNRFLLDRVLGGPTGITARGGE